MKPSSNAGASSGGLATDLAPLTDTYRVITYARRGYPGSEPVASSWGEHAEDAADLIEFLHAVPCTVVAWSGGSIVALELALASPRLVSALVLLDPAAYLRRHATLGFAWTLARIWMLRRLGQPRGAVAVWQRATLAYRGGGSAFDRIPPERRRALLDGAAGMFADLGLGDGPRLDPAQLRGLRVPVAVITGDLHPAALARTCDFLISHLRDPEVIRIANAGHALLFDQPDTAIAALRAVLSRMAARRPSAA